MTDGGRRRHAAAVVVASLDADSEGLRVLLRNVNAAGRFLQHQDPARAALVDADDETDALLLGLVALVIDTGTQLCGDRDGLKAMLRASVLQPPVGG